jgi:hypothetical protein
MSMARTESTPMLGAWDVWTNGELVFEIGKMHVWDFGDLRLVWRCWVSWDFS